MHNNIFRFNRLAGDAQQQEKMADALVSALQRALYERAYVTQHINEEEFTDHNSDTDGRKCFRAGVVALEEGHVADAFWWYHKGNTEFCPNSTTVIYNCDKPRNDELHNLALRSKHTYRREEVEYYEWEITACCYVTSPWGVTDANDYPIGSMVSNPERPEATFWYTEKQFYKYIDAAIQQRKEWSKQIAESMEQGIDFTYDEEVTDEN